ncbi:DUF6318 family protein [Kribbella albertanoniae]|uniref:DUF6318 domain-containing protein n=1 Tax=Kribbella albertanoniae TaxID=1266829 RepID=A0A4R4NVT1_9ACTN|nr:DUF6318 family protein [Kribbella albertanoniae]TDC13898.1 hypothetical protein E1261_44480 [Kribbella albertanoniae]
MTIRNIPTFLAATCLSTLLLSACGPGSPEAGRPNTAPPSTSSSDPTATPPVSSSKPTEPPPRPTAAQGLTLASAEEFVRYYSALMNYAADTGDTSPMLDASESGCENCKSYATSVQRSNAANGLLTGDYHEHLAEVSELVRGESGRLGGSANVTVGAYTTKESAKATPFKSKPAKYKREFALSPQAGSWVMYEMKSVAQ